MAGATDMRRGFDGLASLIARTLNHDPFSGALDIFRGRRGHPTKILVWRSGESFHERRACKRRGGRPGSGQGWCCYAKRLERGHFVWPVTKDGAVSLTPAQLSMLTEGIDWRAPVRTWQPELV